MAKNMTPDPDLTNPCANSCGISCGEYQHTMNYECTVCPNYSSLVRHCAAVDREMDRKAVAEHNAQRKAAEALYGGPYDPDRDPETFANLSPYMLQLAREFAANLAK